MQKIYQDNGLPFFDAAWIRDRNYIQSVVTDALTFQLKRANPAWDIHQIEAPMLIPRELVNAEYDADDLHLTQDYVLRPETTAASYEYARYLLDHQESKPPFCVWQATKSFRRENDQVTANVRLKEFYQQEFQCIYTEDTKKDYYDFLPALAAALAWLLNTETQIVPSDRLPSYSMATMDIEAKTPHKWLEIVSISKRTDVPFDWNGKKLFNTEFAFGLDRLTYVKRLSR